MSSPYHGSPNDDDQAGRDGADKASPDLPAYRPTPHPEDAGPHAFPSYGMGYGMGYRQGVDGGYRPRPLGAAAMEQGSGRIDVMRAISWGFRQAYRNWPVWILGVLVFMAFSGLAGAIGGLVGTPGVNGAGMAVSSVLNVLVSLALVAVGVFALRGALHQVDEPGMGWGHFTRDVNFWPTLLLQFIIGLLTTALMALVAGGILLGSVDQFADPTALDLATEAELAAWLAALVGALALVLLVSVLLNPLVVFMPYYLVERRADLLGSVREGFRAGIRNYLRLLLTYAAAGVLAVLAVVLTFGVAAIFLVGPWYLAQAHMYRQAAGGAIPAR
ncbi:hypothetical protein [Corynebacterium guangdongense]|uniref:Membrane protein n=1 Tax=Corynebacterium guangdongense TaxID=1783348 RepID=A0ABU1ZX42_9CORY|nr:hypothetical protein [Corynebacterium guangdongense]MDR7329506.1 putative membrane protein [Corynebacterium guangdongense]WJZ18071.1 hypothetical protein CGUA_07545 [Corynebacterium guangdongense]